MQNRKHINIDQHGKIWSSRIVKSINLRNSCMVYIDLVAKYTSPIDPMGYAK